MIDAQVATESTTQTAPRNYFTIPNVLSASRFLAALALMFAAPLTLGFWILYGWCGLSDIIDGPIARHQGTASNFGSMLDTIGDSTLVLAMVIAFFPSIIAMGKQGIIATIIAGGSRVTALALMARRRGPEALHSTPARLLGLILFVCPVAVAVWGFAPVFLTACAITLVVTACELLTKRTPVRTA